MCRIVKNYGVYVNSLHGLIGTVKFSFLCSKGIVFDVIGSMKIIESLQLVSVDALLCCTSMHAL